MTSTPATQENVVEQKPKTALWHLGSHLRFWPIVIVVLTADLWLKNWVFASIDPDAPRTIIPHVIEFHRSLNDGAVFGSLTGMVTLFVFASLFAFIFVMTLFAGSLPRQKGLHIALALILAGAMGNFYDRVFVIADVIHFNDGSKVIGKIVDDSDEDLITVANWPAGPSEVRYFRKNIAEMSRQGVVRDFIKFIPKFPSWTPVLGGSDVWPWIFNIADSGLVCGVGLLLIHFGIDRRRTVKSASIPDKDAD